MPTLSVRRSGSSTGALLSATIGLGLGFVAGFLAGGLSGDVRRERFGELVTGFRTRDARPARSSRIGALRDALAGESGLDGLDLRVVPAGPHRVELHGWVPDRATATRAWRFATGAAPALEITNRVQVRGEDDADLTARRPA